MTNAIALIIAILVGIFCFVCVIYYILHKIEERDERKRQKDWWESRGPYDIRPITTRDLKRKRSEPWEC